MKGIEVEEVKPILIDPAMGLFEKLWRAPFGADRFYFRKDKRTGIIYIYSGYSRWTGCVLGLSDFLVEWKVKQGEDHKQVLQMAASLGSLFHTTVSLHYQLENGVKYSHESDALWKRIEAEVHYHGWPRKLINLWHDQVRNDMAAFFKWIEEYEVEVLACETPIYSDEFLIGTPADMICMARLKKSPQSKFRDEEKTRIIVDFKTGKAVGYDSNLYQLGFLQWAWNQKAPDRLKIERVFNWHPKDRSLSPGNYAFVEQTGKVPEERLLHKMKENVLFGYNNPEGLIKTFSDQKMGEITFTSPGDWLVEFFEKH